ncbi:CapA family protein [Patescibacteria group bacterium]
MKQINLHIYIYFICCLCFGVYGFLHVNKVIFSVNKTAQAATSIPSFPTNNISPPKQSFQSIPIIQPLTLEMIFSTAQNISKHDQQITLTAIGDVGLVRSINAKMISTNNVNWPFEKTAKILKKADLTLINLEGALSSDCPTTIDGMVLCGILDNINALLYAGVDVAHIANNHIGDTGKTGISETISLLQKNNITPIGHTTHEIIANKDTQFAFLGYNLIPPKHAEINWATQEQIVSDISSANQLSDFIIVSIHWGVEYTEQPSKEQQSLAHAAINAGADLIIGHHPHWIQPIEIYKDKLIFYSLGNFIFDQMWSQKTREGLIAEITIQKQIIVDVTLHPILIEHYGQPRILTGIEKQNVLSALHKASIKLTEQTPVENHSSKQ